MFGVSLFFYVQGQATKILGKVGLISINGYTKRRFDFLNKKETWRGGEERRTENARWETRRGLHVVTNEQAHEGICGECRGWNVWGWATAQCSAVTPS